MPNKRNRKRIHREHNGVEGHKHLAQLIRNKYNRRSYNSTYRIYLHQIALATLVEVLLCRVSVMQVSFPFYLVIERIPYAWTRI